MYEQLQRDHVELTDIAEELRRRTDELELTDAGALGRCRWRLARTLTRHLALEDRHIYARLGADPRPDVALKARRYQTELGHLRGQYDAHMAEWTGDAIARDWPGYCRAVRALLAALRTRIVWEDRELYPLIAPETRAAA